MNAEPLAAYVLKQAHRHAQGYMILNISTDPAERNMIWLVTGITFAILAVYSFFWIKIKMRMPVFKSVPLEKVMAMENSMYYSIRKRLGIWK